MHIFLDAALLAEPRM